MALIANVLQQARGISLRDIAEQVRVEQSVDEPLEDVGVELRKLTSERIQAVAKWPTSKGRSVDAHGPMRNHRIEFRVIQECVGRYAHRDLFLIAKAVGRKEVETPLALDNVAYVLSQELTSRLDVDDEDVASGDAYQKRRSSSRRDS